MEGLKQAALGGPGEALLQPVFCASSVDAGFLVAHSSFPRAYLVMSHWADGRPNIQTPTPSAHHVLLPAVSFPCWDTCSAALVPCPRLHELFFPKRQCSQSSEPVPISCLYTTSALA